MARPTAPGELQMFVSHQWRDKQLADRLGRDMERFGPVWMDYRDLLPGDDIHATIGNVLAGVDLMLVVWTRNAHDSTGVQDEIARCRELGVRIVPCIFSYDDEGRTDPPLSGDLASTVSVGFHHYGSGLARLSELVLRMTMAELPTDSELHDAPGATMLRYLQGYLSYLANYRELKDVPDERAGWVDGIITEIERYVAEGGDRDAVAMLLEISRRSTEDDPEGIGMLVSRLERLLHGDHGPVEEGRAGARSATSPPASLDGAFPPTSDERLRSHVTAVVPPGSASAWQTEVESYIALAPPVLAAMAAQVRDAGSPAGAQVVGHLQSYLDTDEDLIPDRLGGYGLLDDAWLVVNTAFRLVESGLLPAEAVPVDWPRVIAADHVIRAILPPEVLATLTGAVFEMLQMIADEVTGYQPWFTPQTHGYSPTMATPAAAGGTWEDRMNAQLLGTGLSV